MNHIVVSRASLSQWRNSRDGKMKRRILSDDSKYDIVMKFTFLNFQNYCTRRIVIFSEAVSPERVYYYTNFVYRKNNQTH